MKEINKEYRTPSDIENFIIKQYIKDLKYLSIEMFILVSFINSCIFFCIYKAFSGQWLEWIMGGLMLLIALVISLFLITLWSEIKELSISREYKIYSDQGEWKIEPLIEAQVKIKSFISRINGRHVKMIIPQMYTPPTPKNSKNIKYEYVKILDEEPVFGSNFVFISINENFFNEKHRNFMANIKYTGILSIIISFIFCFVFMGFIQTDFKDSNLGLISLGLSFFFFRTILRWINNKKLVITLNE